jgi:hypothetical protein
VKNRFARTHHPVDLDQRFQFVAGRVDVQGAGNVRALIQIVDVQQIELLDAGIAQRVQQLLGYLRVGGGQNFAGFLVDHSLCDDPPDQILVGNFKRGDARFLDHLHVTGSDPLALGHQDLAGLAANVEERGFAAQALGHQFELGATLFQSDTAGFEECPQDLLVIHAQCAQQDGDRQFAAAVDAREDTVLGVELEVQPGAAVGDHARGEQQLAAGVRLAAVVVVKHAGRAVQLRNDDALGAVDDEGAGFRHQRQIAHVDFLLLDVLDRLDLGRALLVVNHEADLDPQRRTIGHATELAFLDIEHRVAELVADVLQSRIAGVRDDREHRFQGAVKSTVAAIIGRNVKLQKLLVGADLRFQQIGDVQDGPAFAKILADTLFFGKRVTHVHSARAFMSYEIQAETGRRPASPAHFISPEKPGRRFT